MGCCESCQFDTSEWTDEFSDSSDESTEVGSEDFEGFGRHLGSTQPEKEVMLPRSPAPERMHGSAVSGEGLHRIRSEHVQDKPIFRFGPTAAPGSGAKPALSNDCMQPLLVPRKPIAKDMRANFHDITSVVRSSSWSYKESNTSGNKTPDAAKLEDAEPRESRKEVDCTQGDYSSRLGPDGAWQDLLLQMKAWDESVTLDNGVACQLKERSLEEWVNRPPPEGFPSWKAYLRFKVQKYEETDVYARRPAR